MDIIYIYTEIHSVSFFTPPNKLIHYFIPKGVRLEDFSHSDIKRIERWISNYPRRLFGFKTSDQIFAA